MRDRSEHPDQSPADGEADDFYLQGYLARKPQPSAGAPDGAAAPAAGAAGGAVAPAPAGAGGGTPKQKPPLRGLAMILLAVAVILLAWALYQFLRGQDDSPAGVTGTTAVTTAPAATTATPATAQPGDPAPAPAPGSAAAPGDPAAPAPDPAGAEAAPGAPAPAPAPAPGAPPAPAPAPGAPPAPAPVDPAAVKQLPVAVMNNSTVNGLAAATADDLRGKGWTIGEVGNLPGYAFDRTTVLFTPGNPVEEQAARDLAATLGGIAAAREGDNPGMPPGVVVALVAR
ncbi:LytR C-terminal domain-containing protein [Corynebacterium mendelii]|uniref:LytR C-terminal domain-containing protein n=1 Tax=Corynebacterium mendelii TaxID=2765362 RepID=UPI00362AA69B